MAMWNPWRGCRKYSEGCQFCYIHKGDKRRGIDTNQIIRTDNFVSPIEKNKKGEYKLKSGQVVYLCFSSDFLLDDADDWRMECWQMIKARPDLHFIFLTKRIERFEACIPDDWGSGYENVTVGCTIENQSRADERLSIFKKLPIIHKNVICQPLIEGIDIVKYLDDVELVVVGGESDQNARPLDYNWVMSLRQQCIQTNTNFEFRQCGTHFIKDDKRFKLNVRQLCAQARKAAIDYKADDSAD
jgi:protein gp37